MQSFPTWIVRTQGLHELKQWPRCLYLVILSEQHNMPICLQNIFLWFKYTLCIHLAQIIANGINPANLSWTCTCKYRRCFFSHGFDFHESIRIPFYWHSEVTGPLNPINPVIFPLTILTIRDFMAPRSHLHQEIGGTLDQSTAAGCMTAPQSPRSQALPPTSHFFWIPSGNLT